MPAPSPAARAAGAGSPPVRGAANGGGTPSPPTLPPGWTQEHLAFFANIAARQVTSELTPKMLTMGDAIKAVQHDVNNNSKEIHAMKTIVKPAPKKGYGGQAPRNALAIDMSVSVFKENCAPNLQKLRALLTSCYTKGLYLEPFAGIQAMMYIHNNFGEMIDNKMLLDPCMEVLSSVMTPKLKRQPEQALFVDEDTWASMNKVLRSTTPPPTPFLAASCVASLTNCRPLCTQNDWLAVAMVKEVEDDLMTILRNGRTDHIRDVILIKMLERAGLKKKSDVNDILAQKDVIDDMRDVRARVTREPPFHSTNISSTCACACLLQGQLSDIPGPGYGTCGTLCGREPMFFCTALPAAAFSHRSHRPLSPVSRCAAELFGYQHSQKKMLGEDAAICEAFREVELHYRKELERMNLDPDGFVEDSMFIFGTHCVVVHETFRVYDVGDRTGRNKGVAGYGVLSDVDKLKRKIKAMVNWLMNPEQCPTDNTFIRAERARLTRIAQDAEDAGEGAY